MRILASTLALSLVALPAAAQTPPAPSAPAEQAAPADRKPSSIDDLFDRLGKATDEAEAKGIASLIERRWSRSGSDTADLLLSRAAQATSQKDYPLAIELLDRVLVLEPEWVSAWYQRATVFYLLDDPVSAMADIRQVITREPRHFGAWVGLGHIFMTSTTSPAPCRPSGGLSRSIRSSRPCSPWWIGWPRRWRARTSDARRPAGSATLRPDRLYAFAACSWLTKAMRTMFVAPGVPKGMPATTITRSPTCENPSRTANLQARDAMSSMSLASLVLIGCTPRRASADARYRCSG